jgi:hypothetical protein
MKSVAANVGDSVDAANNSLQAAPFTSRTSTESAIPALHAPATVRNLPCTSASSISSSSLDSGISNLLQVCVDFDFF